MTTISSMNNRGIILIATTHAYYGRVAYNLAVTIKANCGLPIAIVADEVALSHLNQGQKDIFDTVIPTKEYGLNLKLKLYELSPFKETVYIDSDTLISKDINPLLDDFFTKHDFAITNEGYFDIDKREDHTSKKYTWWANLPDIIDAYRLKGKLYQCRTEFIVFKKTRTVKKLFTEAAKISKNLKVPVEKFGLSLPDELPLNIAMNKVGIEPHKAGFQPLYWQYLHNSRYPDSEFIVRNNIGISLGGAYEIPHQVQQMHKTILGAAAYKIKAGLTFGHTSKRLLIPERARL